MDILDWVATDTGPPAQREISASARGDAPLAPH
jgi:hypothetical protein